VVVDPGETLALEQQLTSSSRVKTFRSRRRRCRRFARQGELNEISSEWQKCRRLSGEVQTDQHCWSCRGNETQQVLLQVRVAEVNRKALTEAGLNLFASAPRFAARSTTQQFAAPDINIADKTVDPDFKFTDFLNLFFFSRTQGIGGVLKRSSRT